MRHIPLMALKNQNIKEKLRKPIIFVGLMGAGKTAMGQCLAEHLGLDFYDSDDVIVKQEGMSVADIFQKSGENYFRQCEKDVLSELLEHENVVISPGGGAIMQPETATLMQEKGIVVWLKADIDTLVKRVGENQKRPLLHDKDPHTVLQELYEQRVHMYKTAHIPIDANGSMDDVFSNIMAGLEEYLKK